jgi:hypothetical protein
MPARPSGPDEAASAASNEALATAVKIAGRRASASGALVHIARGTIGQLCCRPMDDWLKRVAAAVGSDEQLSGEDADALLKIARIAAHESDDRRNAPLLCYLIGRMQTDRPLSEILETVKASSSS